MLLSFESQGPRIPFAEDRLRRILASLSRPASVLALCGLLARAVLVQTSGLAQHNDIAPDRG